MAQDSALYDWLIHSVHSLNLTEASSVTQWLEDLRLMTETECMCVLQGKSLTKDNSDVVLTNNKSTKDYMDSIRTRAHIVSSEFTKLFRKIDKGRWRHVKTGISRLTIQIRALLQECNGSAHCQNQEFSELQQKLMEECAKLANYVEMQMDINGQKPQITPVVQLLTALGHTFSKLVDLALGILVRKLLHDLEDFTLHHNGVTAVINHLLTVALEGEHLCYLIAREGGVSAMINVCRNKSWQPSHTVALRTVATLCCVPESIEQLEKVGGVGFLTDVLGDKSTTEAVKSEAAGVVAQITSPMLDNYQHLSCFIENMDDLVQTLTELCRNASGDEVFLLGVAAIANITFMDSMACDFLLQYGTIRVLVDGCHSNRASSLFAKDQVSTVLANMAAVEGCCADIVENDGIPLLVKLLNTLLPSDDKEAETRACERVLQKTAIAITRICRDLQTAQKILDNECIPRIIQLCRDPKERNNNDSVLVACLAALRKISNLCGVEDFRHSDVQELIEPKLMDSFLSCSNSDESFV